MQAGDLELSSNPNVVSVICEHESQLMSTIHLNYVQYPQRFEYEVVGDRGFAIADMTDGKIRIGLHDTAEITCETVPPERDNLYRDEHQAFIESVEGKREPEALTMSRAWLMSNVRQRTMASRDRNTARSACA